MPEALATWHDLVRTRNAAGIEPLLAEDAVFLSPIVHTPQQGRAAAARYLQGAFSVLAGPSFRYTGEWHAAGSAVLEFECVVDGITINGVDLIWWNDAGLITRFKVMVRPLKAVNMLHQHMAALLAAFPPAAGA